MSFAQPTPEELARINAWEAMNTANRIELDARRKARRQQAALDRLLGRGKPRGGARPMDKLTRTSSLVYRHPPVGR